MCPDGFDSGVASKDYARYVIIRISWIEKLQPKGVRDVLVTVNSMGDAEFKYVFVTCVMAPGSL